MSTSKGSMGVPGEYEINIIIILVFGLENGIVIYSSSYYKFFIQNTHRFISVPQ